MVRRPVGWAGGLVCAGVRAVAGVGAASGGWQGGGGICRLAGWQQQGPAVGCRVSVEARRLAVVSCLLGTCVWRVVCLCFL